MMDEKSINDYVELLLKPTNDIYRLFKKCNKLYVHEHKYPNYFSKIDDEAKFSPFEK
jgi:hypothetical protein